jgi:O-acetyl-ADP-ribose deacetylase (regulator of RNase III)
LPCKDIIHAVGPLYAFEWKKDMYEKQLKDAVLEALMVADQKLYCKSISIPAIGTDGYNVPRKFCA